MYQGRVWPRHCVGLGVRGAILHQPPQHTAEQMHRDHPAAEARAGEPRWLVESPNFAAGQRIHADRTVCFDNSEYQSIWIFDNAAFWRVLALDGFVQTTERDEFIYHEMMAHVPMLAIGARATR